MGYVVDQVVAKLLEVAKRKNKGGMDLKPMHVKSQVWVFVNCLIENPSFDSQTKENMTLKSKNFGSTCSLSDKFIKGVGSSRLWSRVAATRLVVVWVKKRVVCVEYVRHVQMQSRGG